MNKAESRKDTIKEWLLPYRCKFLFHRLPRAAIFTEFKKIYKQTKITFRKIKNLTAVKARERLFLFYYNWVSTEPKVFFSSLRSEKYK